MKGRITIALWVMLAIVIAATQGKEDSKGSALATPSPSTGITRTVLVGATPAAALDQSLQLARIVIEPGVRLPIHVHPGTQLASIVSGELTYSVVLGQIRIERASIDGAPGPVEMLMAGKQTVLRPGDAVIETEGVEHFGENLGSEPVVILTATLFEAGAPASLAVATPEP
jgi:quercetin dioxygenase-like cupin family protein